MYLSSVIFKSNYYKLLHRHYNSNFHLYLGLVDIAGGLFDFNPLKNAHFSDWILDVVHFITKWNIIKLKLTNLLSAALSFCYENYFLFSCLHLSCIFLQPWHPLFFANRHYHLYAYNPTKVLEIAIILKQCSRCLIEEATVGIPTMMPPPQIRQLKDMTDISPLAQKNFYSFYFFSCRFFFLPFYLSPSLILRYRCFSYYLLHLIIPSGLLDCSVYERLYGKFGQQFFSILRYFTFFLCVFLFFN